MLSLQLMKYAIVPILIMCLTACHVKTKQANKRGLEYMKQNRYEQAVAEFNDILQEDAYWLPAYYNRAIALANIQQYKKALEDFNYVLAHYPDHADAYFNRGIVYENLGLYANAIQDYTETIRLRPGFIQAYHYRGIARFRMLDLDGALQDYNRALELGRNLQIDLSAAKALGLNSSALYFNRGAVFQKKGDYESAIADYTETIRIDPSSAKAYYNRGIAKLSLSQGQEAASDFEIASRLGYTPAQKALEKYFGD